MKNTTSRISLTLLLMTVSSALVAADSMQAIADRTLIRELMDRYGIVHDSGTPEEYANLFTADGEIAVASGGPAIVKGREALIAQARRDHERFGNEPAANGKTTSIMRHLISNAQITITGAGTATGTCYVTTVVKKGDVGPSEYLQRNRSATLDDAVWAVYTTGAALVTLVDRHL